MIKYDYVANELVGDTTELAQNNGNFECVIGTSGDFDRNSVLLEVDCPKQKKYIIDTKTVTGDRINFCCPFSLTKYVGDIYVQLTIINEDGSIIKKSNVSTVPIFRIVASVNAGEYVVGEANNGLMTDMLTAYKNTAEICEVVKQKLDSGEFVGVAGDRGLQGVQGAQGVQGVQGVKGDTGAQGVQGEKGNIGDRGLQGVKGDSGTNGTAVKVAGEQVAEFYPDSYYKVADVKITTETSNVNISNLDIVRDGGIYDIYVCGATAASANIFVRVNNVSYGYKNGTIETGSGYAGVTYYGSRGVDVFYFAGVVAQNGVSAITLQYNPVAKRTFLMSESAAFGWGSPPIDVEYRSTRGILEQNIDNVTSVQLVILGTVLLPGTRILVYRRK